MMNRMIPLLMLVVCSLSSGCLSNPQAQEFRQIAYELREEGGAANLEMANRIDKVADKVGEYETHVRQLGERVAAIGTDASTGNYGGAIAGILGLITAGGAAVKSGRDSKRAKEEAKKEIMYERDMARLARGEKAGGGVPGGAA